MQKLSGSLSRRRMRSSDLHAIMQLDLSFSTRKGHWKSRKSKDEGSKRCCFSKGSCRIGKCLCGLLVVLADWTLESEEGHRVALIHNRRLDAFFCCCFLFSLKRVPLVLRRTPIRCQHFESETRHRAAVTTQSVALLELRTGLQWDKVGR